MTNSTPLLECRNLQRPAGASHPPLLSNIHLTLHAGERVAIVGKSGSGKSLLLRALAKLDPRATGDVTFRDQSAEAMGIPQFRRSVQYVTQHSTLLPGTVEANLQVPFRLASRQDEAYDRTAVMTQLELLSRNETFLEKQVSTLSGGEARMVTLLRALQLQSHVLLLDEPTSSLDEETALAVEQLIAAWHRADQTRAYLWVTHSLSQARRVSDRIWEMLGSAAVEGALRDGPPVDSQPSIGDRSNPDGQLREVP